MKRRPKFNLKTAFSSLALIAVGVIINVFLEKAFKPQNLPVYMDTFGTVLVSLLSGSFPGVIVALITTFIRSATLTWMNIYFGIISVFIAVCTTWFKNKGFFKKVGKGLSATLFIALVSGAGSAVLTWFVYGFTTGEGVTARYSAVVMDWGLTSEPLSALFIACIGIDLIDKAIIFLAAMGIMYALPERLKDKLDDPLVASNYYGSYARVRRPLLRKIMAIIFAAEMLLGTLACGISFYLYRDASMAKYTEICRGVTEHAAIQIDPDRVDEYIALGEAAEGYSETEQNLYRIKESFSEIEYVYCYKIEEDGCRVVFDLDTDETMGGDPGDLIPFDESFTELLPVLYEGGELDPIVTNDTFGWLLTVYTPVKNAAGETVCYSCADITVGSIATDQAVFISKMFSLFFAVSIIIMNAVVEFVKSGVVFPINAMSKAANDYAFDESGQNTSLKQLNSLEIDTNDEINNLYLSLKKMASDSESYIKEVKHQSELITTMQEEIIRDFAEMVEARDQCTGDHIKKTSYYVEAIAKELKSDGVYADILTDDYIAKLVRSAPLHDVGKIKISDIILNKPGRLTNEEFELMKSHTTEGREILMKTSGIALSSGYLHEAIDMAFCHHERWDGKGYPSHLAGEDIPLSARIMAVADVFDALISRRSYKQPFTYEKAVSIIREESGTHFDPKVVDAFLKISERAYNEEAEPINA